MATGVLPVFIGRATRAADYMLASDKSYTARFRLGVTTDTQDITGNILSVSDSLPTVGELAVILQRFRGKIAQIPPMYSAIKVGGKKLYEIARSGGEVERAPREIEIFSIDLVGENVLPTGNDPSTPCEYTISVSCSKGTYIRTLVHDIGAALGCGAAMTALRRTSTGIFRLDAANTLEEIASCAGGRQNSRIFLCRSTPLFGRYPEMTVDASGEKLCRCGALVPASLAEIGATYRVYGPDGFLMLGETVSLGDQTYLKTVKNFFDVG